MKILKTDVAQPPSAVILLFMLPGAAAGVMSDYYENTWEIVVLVLVLVIVIEQANRN